MLSRRFARLLGSIGLAVVILLIALAVIPARSAVPHLGYGLITYYYDPIQLMDMGFGWIKFFNDPPLSTQSQSVLLRIEVTTTTTIADLQTELAYKLPYAQYVDAWEIGNEPNINANYGWGAAPDALAYKTLLCAAYSQIKAADPHAIVVSAGLAPTGRVTGNYNGHPGHDGLKQDDREFLSELLDNGGGVCLDVVGYHPYGFSADYDAAPDEVSGDPTQNCDQGFCFRGAEKIYELMQQNDIGDKKMWATEFGWITQPPITPTNCLNTSTWEGRAWQIVSDAKQASNLAGAFQYADVHWPWMGAMFVFNLDFNQDPALPECEQMRYYSISGKPAFDALSAMSKNPGFILGRLKADPSQLSYRIEAIDQPLTFTLGISLSNWGWEPVTYTASVADGAEVVPVLLNPTGMLTGTAQRTLLLSIASADRISGTYTGLVTVDWIAYGVNNPTPRTVNLELEVMDTVGLMRVANSSPTPLGQSTAFTAELSGGDAVLYQWNFGDGQIGSGATPTHTYSTLGFYTARVTATNSLTTVTAAMPVTITDAPIIGLYPTSSAPTLLGQTTVFTANLGGGSNVSYQWSFGDGQIGSGTTITHTYAALGIYTVRVTGTNSVSTVAAATAILIIDKPLDQHVYLPLIRR